LPLDLKAELNVQVVVHVAFPTPRSAKNMAGNPDAGYVKSARRLKARAGILRNASRRARQAAQELRELLQRLDVADLRRPRESRVGFELRPTFASLVPMQLGCVATAGIDE
jgi:hypothetical protein